MKPVALLAFVLAALPPAAGAAGANPHFPAGGDGPAGANPPYSAAVLAGKTLYVAGTTGGAAPAGEASAAAAARRVLESFKRQVEAGGATMDDLVWVQIFSSDLADYAAFNEVYRTYFKGPMPTRAYVGVDHLLGGAKFEVMGVAVKP